MRTIQLDDDGMTPRELRADVPAPGDAAYVHFGAHGPTPAYAAAAAAAFTVYAVSFGHAIRARRVTQGTVLDATVTYAIAVLLGVGAVSVTEGAVVAPVPQPAVAGAINVLLVMIGSFLISLIIRLKRSADATGGAP